MRFPKVMAAAAGLALVLSGCGTSAPATTDAAGSGSGGSPVTVKDYQGQPVELKQPAKRVVALEWREMEEVVSLGLQPVGASDLKGYASWNKSAPITGDTIDVGTRREPSVESVAKAKPDLIVGTERSIPDAALEQMKKLAPVLLLKGADATQPYEITKQNLETIAAALGKEQQATALWKEFEDKIAANKEKVQQGAVYTLASASATGSTIDFRMHSDRAFAGAIAKDMGLVNAWKEQGDEAFGIGSLDLEGLSKLPEETTLLIWENGSKDNPVNTTLKDNPLWQSLPMVKNDRVKLAADGVWMYGGPKSMMAWSDELVKYFPKS